MRQLSNWKALMLAVLIAAPLATGCGKTVGETIDDTTITNHPPVRMDNLQ